MNSEQDRIKKLSILAAVAVGIIIIISAIFMFMQFLQRDNQKVVIRNLDSCSKGISNYSKQLLFDQLYALIDAQNSIENKESAKTYYATLRAESCETKEYNYENKISYQTKAIIDVEDYNYYYKIRFNWIKDGRTNIDLGQAQAYCLTPSDFSCQENQLVTEELDDIFLVTPYFGDHFTITATYSATAPSGCALVIEYDPPESVYSSGSVEIFEKEKHTEAMKWLEENGFDPNNYELIRKYRIVH